MDWRLTFCDSKRRYAVSLVGIAGSALSSSSWDVRRKGVRRQANRVSNTLGLVKLGDKL